MNRLQRRVKKFVIENDLETTSEYRLLDLTSELGELAKEVNKSTEYGTTPGDVTIPEDEFGDVLFALLALAATQEIDIESALGTAIEKYEGRLKNSTDPSSTDS